MSINLCFFLHPNTRHHLTHMYAHTWYCISPLPLRISSNTMASARGSSPRSSYRAGPPVMVKVLPEPVCLECVH